MLIVAFISVAFILDIEAQVTIGDGTPPRPGALLDMQKTSAQGYIGGVMLPHVEITDLGLIPAGFSDATVQNQVVPDLEGIIVYNTRTDASKGISKGLYIWDGAKWNSISSGSSSQISCDLSVPFNGNNPATLDCVANNSGCATSGNYEFSFISGGDFAQVSPSSSADGSFTVSMNSNNTALSRKAVLLVIDPCGGSTTFVYTQAPGTGLCDDTNAGSFTIASETNTSICSNGAAYLYLAGTPNTNTPSDYIWSVNNQEVGRGLSYIATTSGKYTVYYKAIGCTANSGAAVQVDVTSASEAPDKTSIIANTNNGYVCDASGTVTLIAGNIPTSGTIVWYQNGRRTTQTGSMAQAGIGTWFATVENGGCSSVPSNSVQVQLDPAGSSTINDFNFTINGQPSASITTLCGGGILNLRVINPQSGVTYTWYVNTTELGTGPIFNYSLPAGTASAVIRCRATRANSCSKEVFVNRPVTTGTVPPTPVIRVNSQNALCGGDATLTAETTGIGLSYIWYKDGVDLGQDQSSIFVTQTGDYTAIALSGGCASQLSPITTIVASDFATVSWVSNPATANMGETKTYSVNLDFPLKESFVWTVTGGTITNGQGTRSITVNFPNATTATVSVAATNACGVAFNGTDYSPLTQSVTVASNCTPPAIRSTSNLNPSVNAGNSTVLSVSVQGTSPIIQWYQGTVGTTTNPVGTGGESFEFVSTTAGTVSFYCVITGCNTSINSPQFTVTVNPNPATLTAGSGTFMGKTCFDINKSNFAGSCGTEAGRSSQAVDFANLAQNINNYVFTASTGGTKQNLRFVVVDNENVLVETGVKYTVSTSIYSGSGVAIPDGAKVTVTLNFKTNLSLANATPLIVGRTKEQAAVVSIYAIYNDGTKDVAVPLTVKVQDCQCCPGYLAIGGEYTPNFANNTSTLGGGNNLTFSTISQSIYFTATGNDLCFYKKDANFGGGMKFADAASGCTNSVYFDADGQGLTWRLPNIAELGFINPIESGGGGISTQPTSAPGTVNMPQTPWSSTARDAANGWYWNYGINIAYYNKIGDYHFVRCVR